VLYALHFAAFKMWNFIHTTAFYDSSINYMFLLSQTLCALFSNILILANYCLHLRCWIQHTLHAKITYEMGGCKAL